MPSYVVTGASRGIGLGLLKKISSDPQNTVFALVRNPEGSEQLKEYLSSGDNKHKNVHVVKMDLEDGASIQAAADSVSNLSGGTLDVLINNGALLYDESSRKSIKDFTDVKSLEDNLLLFFRPNVIGVAQTIQAFIPLLRQGQQKRVLITSSSLGSPRYTLEQGNAHAISYAVSKAALNLVTAKYAIAYKDDGIVFLAVEPGLVKTMPGDPAFVDKTYDMILARVKSKHPDFRRFLTVEQSVDEQLALLAKTTLEQSGSFLHSDGNDGNSFFI